MVTLTFSKTSLCIDTLSHIYHLPKINNQKWLFLQSIIWIQKFFAIIIIININTHTYTHLHSSKKLSTFIYKNNDFVCFKYCQYNPLNHSYLTNNKQKNTPSFFFFVSFQISAQLLTVMVWLEKYSS